MLEKQKGVTLYYQILEYMKNKIESGEWEKGEKIPTEASLSDFFQVSRSTVRQAIAELVQKGDLIRKQGLGTFVSQGMYEGLLFSMSLPEEGGFHKPISIKHMSCTSAVAEQLAIKPGDSVTEVYRIRYIKDEPATLEKSYLNSNFFPGIEDEDLSEKISVIASKKYGIQLVKSKTFIEPVVVNPNEAELLEISPGSPVLLMTRLWTYNETPLMLTKVIVSKCNLFIVY